MTRALSKGIFPSSPRTRSKSSLAQTVQQRQFKTRNSDRDHPPGVDHVDRITISVGASARRNITTSVNNLHSPIMMMVLVISKVSRTISFQSILLRVKYFVLFCKGGSWRQAGYLVRHNPYSDQAGSS